MYIYTFIYIYTSVYIYIYIYTHRHINLEAKHVAKYLKSILGYLDMDHTRDWRGHFVGGWNPSLKCWIQILPCQISSVLLEHRRFPLHNLHSSVSNVHSSLESSPPFHNLPLGIIATLAYRGRITSITTWRFPWMGLTPIAGWFTREIPSINGW